MLNKTENKLKIQGPLIDFILREWLLIVSGAGLLLTSVYTENIPDYSIQELEILFILFVLFVAVNGLQRGGILLKISRKLEKGKAVPFKLVVVTFLLSMIVTNDVALIVVVPLTLALNTARKDILVILEALAANAGSALTPFGNPQNLYIYWFYGLKPQQFLEAIIPFSTGLFIIISASALLLKKGNEISVSPATEAVNPKAYFYGIWLLAVLLIVLHILPVSTGMVVVIYALLFDRKALKIDYALLLSFFFFFGLAENLKALLASEINHTGHIFIFSALVSQITGNVPATLLFAKFTSNWKALLWGSNVGGFGSLLGSFANLIAYRIYVTHESTDKTAAFTGKFLFIGYFAFFLSIALYFTLYGTRIFP